MYTRGLRVVVLAGETGSRASGVGNRSPRWRAESRRLISPGRRPGGGARSPIGVDDAVDRDAAPPLVRGLTGLAHSEGRALSGQSLAGAEAGRGDSAATPSVPRLRHRRLDFERPPRTD